MYLYEVVNWLTTVVDSLVIKESYKEEAYKGALGYIADCLMVYYFNCRWVPKTNILIPGIPNRARHSYAERKCHIKHPR